MIDAVGQVARMNSPEKRVLVTVAGADATGITATLAGIIDKAGAHLRDIEQVVLSGQLMLCLVVGVDPSQASQEIWHFHRGVCTRYPANSVVPDLAALGGDVAVTVDGGVVSANVFASLALNHIGTPSSSGGNYGFAVSHGTDAAAGTLTKDRGDA